jgi:hypothetical protein
MSVLTRATWHNIQENGILHIFPMVDTAKFALEVLLMVSCVVVAASFSCRLIFVWYQNF